jgi:hypothetical protein
MSPGERPFRTVVSAAIQQLLGAYNSSAEALRPVVAQIFAVPELAGARAPEAGPGPVGRRSSCEQTFWPLSDTRTSRPSGCPGGAPPDPPRIASMQRAISPRQRTSLVSSPRDCPRPWVLRASPEDSPEDTRARVRAPPVAVRRGDRATLPAPLSSASKNATMPNLDSSSSTGGNFPLT